MSMSEVEDFLNRVRNGEIEYDTTHPGAKAYEIALETYSIWEKASAAPSSYHIRDMFRAIDIAMSQGVFEPSRQDVEKVSCEMIDKNLRSEI